jgi:hypothetical protein
MAWDALAVGVAICGGKNAIRPSVVRTTGRQGDKEGAGEFRPRWRGRNRHAFCSAEEMWGIRLRGLTPPGYTTSPLRGWESASKTPTTGRLGGLRRAPLDTLGVRALRVEDSRAGASPSREGRGSRRGIRRLASIAARVFGDR